MIVVTLPSVYKEMPLGSQFFVTVPECLQRAESHSEYGQDIHLLWQYAEAVDKNPSQFTAAELWMFATKKNENGKYELANDHYRHYLETGEVLAYDGPPSNVQDHKDIFVACQKINNAYDGSAYIERVTIDENEEIEIVYGTRYIVEKFVNGKLVYATSSREAKTEELYARRPSEMRKRSADKTTGNEAKTS